MLCENTHTTHYFFSGILAIIIAWPEFNFRLLISFGGDDEDDEIKTEAIKHKMLDK